MPKTPKDFSVLSPTCRAQATALKTFLRYFNTVAPLRSGRYVARHYGVIYWPDFGRTARRSTVWLSSFWSRGAQDRERQAASIPPSGPAYRSWHTKTLRRHVLAALGSLVVPIAPTPNSTSGDAWVMYRGQQAAQDIEQDAEALADPENYTVFRRVQPRERTLVRLFLAPPDLQDFLDHEPQLPEEISCLYRAWRTLHLRARTPFDPTQIGLEWSDQGFVFVNWKRFLDSMFAPVDKLPPQHVANILKGGQRKGGVYRLKLSAFPPPENFSEFVQAAGIVETTGWGEFADPCTTLDPHYLFSRSNLFEAPFHQARKARARQTQKAAKERALDRRQARREGRQVAPERVHRTFPFFYLPHEHMPYSFQVGEKPCSILPDQKEVAYAVEYRGQLYFRPPTLHPITKKSPECEREAWLAAMKKLKSVDHFQKTGEIGSVEFQSYSERVAEATEEALTPIAAEHIADFVSFDSLSKQDVKRVRRIAKEEHGLDTSTACSGSEWFQNKIRAIARRTINASSVRRKVTVVIPHVVNKETGEAEPIEATFFSPSAVKTVQACAKDAPYLYAWSTFCIRVAARGILPSLDGSKEAQSRRWTPGEDLILLEDYRAHPRLTRKEKASMLKKLERHDWNAVLRRVTQLNKLLQEVLTASQLERYTVGKLWFPDAAQPDQHHRELQRLIIAIGVATRSRYLGEKLHTRMPLVSKALQLEGEYLDEVALPPYYRTERFEWLAKGEAIS